MIHISELMIDVFVLGACGLQTGDSRHGDFCYSTLGTRKWPDAASGASASAVF